MLTSNLIPSHKVALWLVRHIDRLLESCGLSHYPVLEQVAYLAIIIAIAIAAGLVVRYAVVWLVRKIVRLRDGVVGREILERHVIQKCSHFIPPLVFIGMFHFAFSD